jgi:hypothetical protein
MSFLNDGSLSGCGIYNHSLFLSRRLYKVHIYSWTFCILFSLLVLLFYASQSYLLKGIFQCSLYNKKTSTFEFPIRIYLRLVLFVQRNSLDSVLKYLEIK